jgi:hypothetical protein
VNVNTRSQSGAASPIQPPARVGEDLTFSLSGLFGRQVLQVFGAMRPWVVKAIRYRGDDVFGRWVEFKNSSDANDLFALERLAKAAERITLAEDDQRTIDLKLVRPR